MRGGREGRAAEVAVREGAEQDLQRGGGALAPGVRGKERGRGVWR
jgi:predicted ribosome-associated RNA-binding protein Tma20